MEDDFDFLFPLEDELESLIKEPQDEGISEKEKKMYIPAPPKSFNAKPINPTQIENIQSVQNSNNSIDFSKTQVSSPKSGMIPIKNFLSSPYFELFKFEYFNPVQASCFSSVVYNNFNILVAAPTGSGKTTIMELAIIRMLQQNIINKSNWKGVYMAPLKALCQEMFTKWKSMFSKIGLTCQELTGDTDITNLQEIQKAQLLLTTPEKWDSLTRRWKEHSVLMKEIKLIMIDEVHLLNESRGATLEAVVSRMKTISELNINNDSVPLRFVGISATIPNFNDVAQWLNVPIKGRFQFGEEFRPVPLEKHVVAYKPTKTPFLFDRNLNYKLYEIVIQYSDKKPTLIFCSSRKGATQAAQQLLKDDSQKRLFIKSPSHQQELMSLSMKTQDKTLAECLLQGIAFHSAGMDIKDRRIVEEAFLNQKISVLCTTSTLSQGVNFPAHLVIIKGTQIYKPGIGYNEYSELLILQMMGRAGRPQFDTSGSVVIMTSSENKPKYENLVNNKKDIESSLMNFLAEHLNSEIVLQTITDIAMAVNWLKSTYLWQRCQINPSYYQLPKGLGSVQLESKLKEKLINVLNELQNYGLIEMNDGFELHSLELGKAMARYCVQFKTMQNFFKINPEDGMAEILNILSQAEEFNDLHVRVSEKKILNEINKHDLMHFPYEGKIKSRENKISCLFQASLAGIEIHEYSLKQETLTIFQAAPRILKAMQEYLREKNLFLPLKECIHLQQSCTAKVWFDGVVAPTHTPIRQFAGIGATLASNLALSGIKTVSDLRNQDSSRIEFICKKHPPFGAELIKNCKKLPNFQIDAKLEKDQNQRILIRFIVSLKEQTHVSNYNYNIILAGTDKGKLLYWKRIQTNSLPQEINGLFFINSDESPNSVLIGIMNEEYVGCDCHLEIPIRNEISYLNKTFTPQIIEKNTNSMNQKRKASELEKQENNSFENTNWNEVGTQELQKRSSGICNHKCRNKLQCKHSCCKKGLEFQAHSIEETYEGDEYLEDAIQLLDQYSYQTSNFTSQYSNVNGKGNYHQPSCQNQNYPIRIHQNQQPDHQIHPMRGISQTTSKQAIQKSYNENHFVDQSSFIDEESQNYTDITYPKHQLKSPYFEKKSTKNFSPANTAAISFNNSLQFVQNKVKQALEQSSYIPQNNIKRLKPNSSLIHSPSIIQSPINLNKERRNLEMNGWKFPQNGINLNTPPISNRNLNQLEKMYQQSKQENEGEEEEVILFGKKIKKRKNQLQIPSSSLTSVPVTSYSSQQIGFSSPLNLQSPRDMKNTFHPTHVKNSFLYKGEQQNKMEQEEEFDIFADLFA